MLDVTAASRIDDVSITGGGALLILFTVIAGVATAGVVTQTIGAGGTVNVPLARAARFAANCALLAALISASVRTV